MNLMGISMAYSDYDPDPDSASDSLSDYPHAWDFYSALMLLSVQFLEDIKDLS